MSLSIYKNLIVFIILHTYGSHSNYKLVIIILANEDIAAFEEFYISSINYFLLYSVIIKIYKINITQIIIGIFTLKVILFLYI